MLDPAGKSLQNGHPRTESAVGNFVSRGGGRGDIKRAEGRGEGLKRGRHEGKGKEERLRGG